jgi:hypothetical protein
LTRQIFDRIVGCHLGIKDSKQVPAIFSGARADDLLSVSQRQQVEDNLKRISGARKVANSTGSLVSMWQWQSVRQIAALGFLFAVRATSPPIDCAVCVCNRAHGFDLGMNRGGKWSDECLNGKCFSTK